MRQDFADIVRRLDQPKTNADLRRAIEAVREIARDAFDDAVEVLRDPGWDRPVATASRWGRAPLKEQIWTALLAGANATEVERLWFLAEHPDLYMRKNFIADALSTGHPELLHRARELVRDEEQEVREYVAIGLRDALRVSSSETYAREAAALLLDYVREYPKDSDVARLMALHAAAPDLAAEAERVLAEAHRIRPDADWFVLRGTDLGWGDYGHILVHGMVNHLGRDGAGLAQIERTGPFVPPITLPGLDVLAVTAAARGELEAADLLGLEYRPVELARAVRLAWHEWDLDADEPAKYPSGGEPENYILRRKHNPDLAASFPAMFEVVVSELAPGEGPPDDRDLVRRGPYRLLISRRAKEWMERRWDRWVTFANVDE
jgi:hypothetical protein